jgi:hypothetical protein
MPAFSGFRPRSQPVQRVLRCLLVHTPIHPSVPTLSRPASAAASPESRAAGRSPLSTRPLARSRQDIRQAASPAPRRAVISGTAGLESCPACPIVTHHYSRVGPRSQRPLAPSPRPVLPAGSTSTQPAGGQSFSTQPPDGVGACMPAGGPTRQRRRMQGAQTTSAAGRCRMRAQPPRHLAQRLSHHLLGRRQPAAASRASAALGSRPGPPPPPPRRRRHSPGWQRSRPRRATCCCPRPPRGGSTPPAAAAARHRPLLPPPPQPPCCRCRRASRCRGTGAGRHSMLAPAQVAPAPLHSQEVEPGLGGALDTLRLLLGRRRGRALVCGAGHVVVACSIKRVVGEAEPAGKKRCERASRLPCRSAAGRFRNLARPAQRLLKIFNKCLSPRSASPPPPSQRSPNTAPQACRRTSGRPAATRAPPAPTRTSTPA